MVSRYVRLILTVVAFCAVHRLPAAVPSAGTPNVIVIFCDDLGYQDVGCFGAATIKTPNVDALAAQGMRFTDFYSAYCVCSASRASLLTGSYQPRISMRGVLGPHTRTGLNPDEVTIADLLKTKGYATMCIGKWHVGDTPETLPTAQGFDGYFGLPYSNDMARQKGWGNNPPDLDKIWVQKKWDIYKNELYRDLEMIESPVNQQTLTDRYTDEAITFIKAHKDGPFFLYLANTMPHVPLFVPDRLYDPDPKKAYQLTIEHIDASLGRIMDALNDLNIAGNTFVIFTSDNGPWLSKAHHAGSALPLRAGKATTFEGGMRVPCVMRWPARIKPGQVCRQVAGTIDLIATLSAIVGADLPPARPIDGRDISALLDDPAAASPHDSEGYYYYKNNKLEAVRLGQWKLHLQRKELYDLRADISEANNRFASQPEVVARLTKVAMAYDEELKANTRPAWTSVAAKGGKAKATH